MDFRPNTKIWHPQFKYAYFVRVVRTLEDKSYIEKPKGKLHLVNTSEILNEAPPKPSREEAKRLRFQKLVHRIYNSPTAYYVAGWMASHPTRFTVSTPPRQYDMVVDILIQHGIGFMEGENAISTATDASDNWSCRVATDRFEKLDEFIHETGINVSDYFNDETHSSVQTREFVIGFLGDELRFSFNTGWLNRKQDNRPEFDTIRSRVPAEFLQYFDDGAL